MKRHPRGIAVVLLASLAMNLAWAEPECVPIDPLRDGAKILNEVEQGTVAHLVHCGLNINAHLIVNGAHITALQMAVFTGKPVLVRQILSLGADPDQADSGDSPRPPLELALSRRNYQAAAELMRSGARARYALQPTGMTALMTVVFDTNIVKEHKNILSQLLKQGADVEARDTRSQTVLHWAARSGNAEYARWLLDHGAPACSRDVGCRQALDVIAQRSPAFSSIKATLVKACPRAGDVSSQALTAHGTSSTQTTLHATPSASMDAPDPHALLAAAMDAGDAKAVKALLQDSSNANETLTLKQGQETIDATPLSYAISSKASLAVIDQLVACGADVKQADAGLLPLNFALGMREYTVADYLLRHQARADGLDQPGGMTSLMNLAMSAKDADDQTLTALTKQLLAAGAQVNAKAARQASALTFAVLGGNPRMVRLLLDAEADTNARNDRGETPIDLARQKVLGEIVNVLSEFSRQ